MVERGEVVVEAKEVAKDEGGCSLCGCPLRLHAKIGEWCARCAKPCPPRQAEPVGTKERVTEIVARDVRFLGGNQSGGREEQGREEQHRDAHDDGSPYGPHDPEAPF